MHMREVRGAPLLVALDVDGTLLTSRHRVTDRTKRVLCAVRERGVTVVLATSRAPRAVLPIVQTLGMPGPVVFVASQGAVTATVKGDERMSVLHRRSMDIEDARSVSRSAAAHGLAVNWFTTDEWFVSEVDEGVRREASVVGLQPRVVDVSRLREPPDKIMLISPEAVGPTVLRALRIPSSLAVTQSNPTYLEITRAGVDKAAALKRYCHAVGIPGRRVAAFGDGLNDLALFDFAGLSVAPANAHPTVRKAATCVTASNDEDGVARALGTILGVT